VFITGSIKINQAIKTRLGSGFLFSWIDYYAKMQRIWHITEQKDDNL